MNETPTMYRLPTPTIDDLFNPSSPSYIGQTVFPSPPNAQNAFTEGLGPQLLASGQIQGGATNSMTWDGVTMTLAGRIFAINSQMSTTFEGSARFTPGTGGGGTVTYGAEGLDLETTTTISSHAFISWGAISVNLFRGSPVFSATFEVRTKSADGQLYCGLGNMNLSTNVFTTAHIGFKIEAGILYATQADGTTESSVALATVNSNDIYNVVFKVDGTKKTDFYFRKYYNGQTAVYTEAFSTGFTLSANMPSSITPRAVFSVNNNGGTNNFRALFFGATYSV